PGRDGRPAAGLHGGRRGAAAGRRARGAVMRTSLPLQVTLEAEHAAAHLFGVLAAQTSRAEQPDRFAAASARHAVHLARRDSLVDQLRAREATPVAAAPAYEIPALGSPELVMTAGCQIEQRCLA